MLTLFTIFTTKNNGECLFQQCHASDGNFLTMTKQTILLYKNAVGIIQLFLPNQLILSPCRCVVRGHEHAIGFFLFHFRSWQHITWSRTHLIALYDSYVFCYMCWKRTLIGWIGNQSLPTICICWHRHLRCICMLIDNLQFTGALLAMYLYIAYIWACSMQSSPKHFLCLSIGCTDSFKKLCPGTVGVEPLAWGIKNVGNF